MSLKSVKSKTPVKRTTTRKTPLKKTSAIEQVQALTKDNTVVPTQVFIPGAGWLELPKPALLAERQEADDLIKKLTDTLPARLDDEVAMGQASEHLIITRKLRKAFEEKLKEVCKPIKQAIEDLKNDYNPYVVKLEAVETKLNGLLNAYRTEATRKQQLEQQRLDDAHRKTMDEARAQGVNPLSIPVPQAAPAPPVGFQTAHGKTTTMRVPKWRCTDPTQVPYEYNGVKLWLLNDAGIGALRRGAGVEAQSPIAGIEYFYDETTVVK